MAAAQQLWVVPLVDRGWASGARLLLTPWPLLSQLVWHTQQGLPHSAAPHGHAHVWCIHTLGWTVSCAGPTTQLALGLRSAVRVGTGGCAVVLCSPIGAPLPATGVLCVLGWGMVMCSLPLQVSPCKRSGMTHSVRRGGLLPLQVPLQPTMLATHGMGSGCWKASVCMADLPCGGAASSAATAATVHMQGPVGAVLTTCCSECCPCAAKMCGAG